MISKPLLVICVALAVIAVESAETTTCTSRCLDGSTKSVTCMGDCSATQQRCSGSNALGGVAECETGSQSTRSACSSNANLCSVLPTPCRVCSPVMCGTHSDNCGGVIYCGPCPKPQLCLVGRCSGNGKCCKKNSDCKSGPCNMFWCGRGEWNTTVKCATAVSDLSWQWWQEGKVIKYVVLCATERGTQDSRF